MRKRAMVARQPPRRQGGCPALQLAMHETDDILDSLHGFGGDRLFALRTLRQYSIDMPRVLYKFLHLGGDRSQFGDCEIDQSCFEGGKLAASKLPKHFGFAHAL